MTLEDTPELRRKRREAYESGRYRFDYPPVHHLGWDAEAWMNWVKFDDQELTGFLPYRSTSAEVKA